MIENVPPDIIDSFQLSLIETIRPLLFKFSLMVGGIFGLYLLLILIRIYYERRKVKLLQDIRFDLDRLNIHHGIRYSKHRKSKIKRFFEKLFKRK